MKSPGKSRSTTKAKDLSSILLGGAYAKGMSAPQGLKNSDISPINHGDKGNVHHKGGQSRLYQD